MAAIATLSVELTFDNENDKIWPTAAILVGGADMMSLLFMRLDASQVCLHIAMIEVVDLVSTSTCKKLVPPSIIS